MAQSGGLLSHLSTLLHHSSSPPPPHSIADISSKLTSLSIHHDDVKLLAKQEVDGDCLAHISEQSLAALGVPTLGRRVKLLKAVQTIQAEWGMALLGGGGQGGELAALVAGAVKGAGAGSEKRSPAVAPASPRSTGKPNAEDEDEPRSPPAKKKGSADKEKEKEKTKPKEKEKEKEKETDKVTASKAKDSKEKEKDSTSRDKDASSKEKPTRAKSPLPSPSDDEEETDSSKSKRPSTAPSKDLKPIKKADLSSSQKLHPAAASDTEEEGTEKEEAEEVDSDTDIERQFQHPRASPPKAETKAKKASDDDDLFATSDATAKAEFMAVKPWLGAVVAPSKAPKSDPSPPDAHLKLEWVHGYRAFDSRSNLVYNAVGDIVYPAAAVVVVYNAKGRKQRHFTGHNDDIRCLAQHPLNGNLIATGQNSTVVKGKSTACYVCVFDSTDFSKQWVLKMEKEDRAVRSVTFSGCGKFIVTVSDDDNHTLKVWDWETQKMLTSAKGDASPIFMVRGNHKDKTEFVTVGKRHAMFWTWDAEGKKLVGKRSSMGGGQPLTFYSVAFSEKGYACLGCEDGGVYVFSGGKPAKTFPHLHDGKVLSIDYYAGGIVTGGSDCVVNVLDKRMEVSKKLSLTEKVSSVHIRDDDLLIGTMGAQVYQCLDYAHSEHEKEEELDLVTQGHSDGELWALAMSPDGKTYATVGEDNAVAVWDVVTHKCLRRSIITEKKGKKPKILRASTTSTHPVNQCARAIAIAPNNKSLIIGQNSGEVSVYDYKSLKLIASVDVNKQGKRQVKEQKDNWIQAIQYSPSGHAVAVGTHGSVVVVLDPADGYKVKGVMKASNSFLTHLDWSEDGHYVQTNDGAYELLWYSVDEDDLCEVKQVTSATSMRDVKWATQSCVLGWGVQGVYDAGQGGQEVASVDVSPDGHLCVSGDDRGMVNLYRWPVLKGAKSNGSHCHSSHVTTVRFSADDKYVLSAGGHDLTIMQWLIV